MSKLIIQRMSKEDITMAVNWAATEGWNPGLRDAECFYAADPQGFFIGKLSGKPIAVGSAIAYNDRFAFCGFYIIKPAYRGQGYGMQLTQTLLDYAGNRIIGIDGVLGMLNKYENIGFTVAHLNARYRSAGWYSFPVDKAIVDLCEVPFLDLLDYDKQYFPASRSTFLTSWITQTDCYSLAYLDKGKLSGYGVIKKCREGYKMGPLFSDSFAIADFLFRALVTKAGEPPFYLDIPKSNKNALQLVSKYKMEEVFSTARMYRNGNPNLNLDNIYGITTFELG